LTLDIPGLAYLGRNDPQALRDYRATLRKRPGLPPPALDDAMTSTKVRAGKDQMRADDQARIDLRLATPARVQAENDSLGGVPSKTLRIIRHAQDA
jgi:hypothetical protein